LTVHWSLPPLPHTVTPHTTPHNHHSHFIFSCRTTASLTALQLKCGSSVCIQLNHSRKYHKGHDRGGSCRSSHLERFSSKVAHDLLGVSSGLCSAGRERCGGGERVERLFSGRVQFETSEFSQKCVQTSPLRTAMNEMKTLRLFRHGSILRVAWKPESLSLDMWAL
jgi:hypothetical protein